jgi:membrane-associated protease RseP (regulator of RpoE activity)
VTSAGGPAKLDGVSPLPAGQDGAIDDAAGRVTERIAPMAAAIAPVTNQPDLDEPVDEAIRPLDLRQAALHLGLFAASCATTYLAGGPWFSATLMTILVCHELGHYTLARYHGVAVSLPYFIPLPWQYSLGTLGAVIRMPNAIRQPHRLFDVGVAGPLAGVAVALPLLVIGLLRSQLGPIAPGSFIEGNSILYAGLKLAVFGRWLPVEGAGGIDVQLHPMAFAAWVGLLVTMINLLPIGQLDGGHLARAVFGARHEVWSRRLHLTMPAIGAVLAAGMFARALAAGRSALESLEYASHGGLPWLTWSLLLLLMRRSAGEYHPAVEETPLDPARRRLAIAVAVLFLLIFTPVPFRSPL